MATKISTELLTMILNNIKSTKSTRDLYSSLLVNRFWCKVTIPILWELPLCLRPNYMGKKMAKKALCIQTYISCMNTQARTLLIQKGFDLSLPPPQATFDYPSFTRKFIINNLIYFISTYSQQIFGPKQNNYIDKSRILLYEVFKLIIDRCSFLDSFKLARVPRKAKKKFQNYIDVICSIFELPSTPKAFKKLKSFTSVIEKNEQICPLYASLELICDNILNMDLKLNSDYQMRLLAKLISDQKRLENLSIWVVDDLNCISIFWAVISQKETLKSLHLKEVGFDGFKWKSSSIVQFVSLQELYIEDCRGLHDSDCLSLASSFTQLSSFYFKHINNGHGHPQEFIIKIFETANSNLKNIRLYFPLLISLDTFSGILKYCTKITELTLFNLSPKQVITIFNYTFDELRQFSFCCGKKFDGNELLCQMAESISESLEIIEINFGIFNVDNLKSFFERWCRKCGGTKKIIVNRKTTGKQILWRKK